MAWATSNQEQTVSLLIGDGYYIRPEEYDCGRENSDRFVLFFEKMPAEQYSKDDAQLPQAHDIADPLHGKGC